ncbi:hypothetical protein CF319_g4279 [Tilletia indica]|nr:hypothetical protein CF319_g4279 [Tilletia indica]
MAPGSSSRGSSRGRGRGRSHPVGDEFKEKSTPAARAQHLFQQQQQQQRSALISHQQAIQQATQSLSSPSSSHPQIPLSTLIKALSSSSSPDPAAAKIDLRRAMSLAKALHRSHKATTSSLQDITKLTLTEHVNWPASDPEMKGKIGTTELSKAVAACRRAASEIEASPSQLAGPSTTATTSPTKGYSWEGKREANDLESHLESKSHSTKRRKISQAEERLSREWGNPLLPLDSQGDPVRSSSSQAAGVVDVGEELDGGSSAPLPTFEIPCVVDEDLLKGRTALVNRAPVMTLWTTILLERMGFQRREALSIAQCYVSTTSTARAVNLGLAPSSDRDKASTAGPKQPHFVLMGVKLPVLQLKQRTSSGEVGEYRAIYDGQVVEPQKAFDYIFRSFYQTLQYVYGALVLLADSYLDPTGQDTDADELHATAWDLYCDFRPETGGEWGKRARVSCDVILGLRKGVKGVVKKGEEGEKIEGTVKVKVEEKGTSNVKTEPADGGA